MNAMPEPLTRQERCKIYSQAIDHYGRDSRLDKVKEECVELVNAIIHYQDGRGTIEDVLEELAGVRITTHQLIEIERTRQPGKYKIALESQARKLHASMGGVDEERVEALANCPWLKCKVVSPWSMDK